MTGNFKSKWYVVDENNNVLAGPIFGLQQVVVIADSVSSINDKIKVGVIREDQLEKKRKEYLESISQHKIFDMLNSEK